MGCCVSACLMYVCLEVQGWGGIVVVLTDVSVSRCQCDVRSGKTSASLAIILVSNVGHWIAVHVI